MSNFAKAIAVLSESCALPVFAVMRDQSRPLPIAVNIHREAMRAAHYGSRNAVKKALSRLTRSKRYLEATAAEGAVRYNADGTAGKPVTQAQRDWARGRLEEKAAAHRKREAASYQTDPKWAAKILSGE